MKFRPIIAAIIALLAVSSSGVARQEGARLAEIRGKCRDCPPLVEVPAGAATLGDDHGFSAAEAPAIFVTLERTFLLTRTEVTFDQWAVCVADGACRGGQDDHGWGRGKRPVINVDWQDAQAFAGWMSTRLGLACRLPSEAEWEYAARAGSKGAYWWGAAVGNGHANCRDCLGPEAPYGSRPVGSFKPNPFGLYDMNGNVWEWTADCWTSNHAGQPKDGSPVGGECRERVIKGGSWYYFSGMSRSAARSKNDATLPSYNIGLRILCELPENTGGADGGGGR